MEKEKISVIIPTYNRANLIKRSVESVLHQTYENIEVIVVDDGSTDNTKEVIDTIIDDRLKYYTYKGNKGACHARNYGIKKATGSIISFHDSDDEYLSDKLLKQYNNMQKCQTIGDFCGMKLIVDDNEMFFPSDKDVETIKKRKNIVELKDLINGNFITCPSIMMRKALAERVMFDEKLPRLQDYDFILRVLEKTDISYTDEVLVNSYRQDDSIGRSNEKLLNAILVMNNKKYKMNSEDKATLAKSLIKLYADSSASDYINRINEASKANDELNKINNELSKANSELIEENKKIYEQLNNNTIVKRIINKIKKR